MFVFILSPRVNACGLISWLQSTHVSIDLFDSQMFVFHARHVYCCCFFILKLLFYLWFWYCFLHCFCLFVCFFFVCLCLCFFVFLSFDFVCLFSFCFCFFSVFCFFLILTFFQKLTLQRFICDKHLSKWNKLWNHIMFC